MAEPPRETAPADASADTPTAIRRRDRAKDDAWIRAFLGRAPFGFLATVSDGRPFLNSNLFVYVEEDHAIYLHTARTGRTPANVEEAGPAAFSPATAGRLLPADEALEFSVEYGGVVAFGRARTLEEPEEKRTALQRLLDKYAPHLRPGRDYRPITDEEALQEAGRAAGARAPSHGPGGPGPWRDRPLRPNHETPNRSRRVDPPEERRL